MRSKMFYYLLFINIYKLLLQYIFKFKYILFSLDKFKPFLKRYYDALTTFFQANEENILFCSIFSFEKSIFLRNSSQFCPLSLWVTPRFSTCCQADQYTKLSFGTVRRHHGFDVPARVLPSAYIHAYNIVYVYGVSI